MNKVLPSIVREDQSGYLKSWYIKQNIKLLQDINFFTELKQLPCHQFRKSLWLLELELFA